MNCDTRRGPRARAMRICVILVSLLLPAVCRAANRAPAGACRFETCDEVHAAAALAGDGDAGCVNDGSARLARDGSKPLVAGADRCRAVKRSDLGGGALACEDVELAQWIGRSWRYRACRAAAAADGAAAVEYDDVQGARYARACGAGARLRCETNASASFALAPCQLSEVSVRISGAGETSAKCQNAARQGYYFAACYEAPTRAELNASALPHWEPAARGGDSRCTIDCFGGQARAPEPGERGPSRVFGRCEYYGARLPADRVLNSTAACSDACADAGYSAVVADFVSNDARDPALVRSCCACEGVGLCYNASEVAAGYAAFIYKGAAARSRGATARALQLLTPAAIAALLSMSSGGLGWS